MAYVKDKKITILKVTAEEDPEGAGWIEVETPLPGGANIWAYFRHLSGREFFAAKQVNAREEVLFEINWRDDLDTTMKVEYKGKKYQITRIDTFEGYKNDIKIYAYIVNG